MLNNAPKLTLHTSFLKKIPTDLVPQFGSDLFKTSDGITGLLMTFLSKGNLIGGITIELVHDSDESIPMMWMALAHRIVTPEGRVIKDRNA